MIRVLHIFHEMANGGIEHFVMDYYRHIDRTRVQFDFLVSVETEGYFDREIEAMGGIIHYAYPLKKNPIRNYYDIARIVRENHYDIVHRHTGSAFGYFDLRAARHGGAKHLILHSHNNKAGNLILHRLSNTFLKIPCERFACSQEAGEWLFGPYQDFKVINNAIDCEKFRFRPDVRSRIRKELQLEDKFVIGHVGRFEEQKNHTFLLAIFKEVVKQKPNSHLICIGTGSMLDTVKLKASQEHLDDRITFLGNRDEIEQFLNTVDVFVLPSKYEGFGITLLEAQANGLNCFTSKDVVSESVNLTGRVKYIPLSAPANEWARIILSVESTRGLSCTKQIADAGFDINKSAFELCQYYESADKVGEA